MEILTKEEADKRIIENAEYQSWHNDLCGFDDSLTDEPELDMSGLDDANKMALFIYAWNKINVYPSKKRLMTCLQCDEKELKKIYRQLKPQIKTSNTYNEDTGKLNGSGYVVDLK